MENSSRVGMVATAGAATGAGVGKIVADHLIKTRCNNVLKYANVDKYVSARQDVAAEKIIGVVKGHRFAEALSKVADRARADFPELVKKAKNTKVKWIAGLAAAGLAIGTAATLIYNKVKANKAE